MKNLKNNRFLKIKKVLLTQLCELAYLCPIYFSPIDIMHGNCKKKSSHY